MTSLSVGINLLYLKPGVVGGSAVYATRLLRALGSEAFDEVELTLFVNRRFGGAYPDLASTHATLIAPISGDSPFVRILFESSWLARETARRPLQLIHHVANTMPHVRTRLAVVTIHDLQPIVRPQDFSPTKGAYLRARLRSAVGSALMVTTPSEYVRRLVMDRFNVEGSRVVVVTAPIIPDSTTGREGRPPEAYGIVEPFFVYPAITHPHKNHVGLIRAFARVAANGADASLLLTGGSGAGEEAVLREIARARMGRRVRRLGRIPRADLNALLRRAVALTFPSYHEGYGLPVAEAMSFGCPVIASNSTALPEVVGDAGMLRDPDDIDGWAEAMLRLLDDASLRAELSAAGRERARSFSPEQAAGRQVAVYRLALETSRRRTSF